MFWFWCKGKTAHTQNGIEWEIGRASSITSNNILFALVQCSELVNLQCIRMKCVSEWMSECSCVPCIELDWIELGLDWVGGGRVSECECGCENTIVDVVLVLVLLLLLLLCVCVCRFSKSFSRMQYGCYPISAIVCERTQTSPARESARVCRPCFSIYLLTGKFISFVA